MKNNSLVNCIIKALFSGAVCWVAFAFGTFIVAHKNTTFLEALGKGQGIGIGVMIAVLSFMSYLMKSKRK